MIILTSSFFKGDLPPFYTPSSVHKTATTEENQLVGATCDALQTDYPCSHPPPTPNKLQQVCSTIKRQCHEPPVC